MQTEKKMQLGQKFFLGWIEHIAGKGESAGYQHLLLQEKEKMLLTSIFSFSLNIFKVIFFRVVKSDLCGKELIDQGP